MAFSATINNQAYMGPGIRKVFGTWTGNAGDAAGTISMGGIVRQATFQKFDTLDQTFQIIPRVEVSTTAGISTITVENQDNVTTGVFELTVFGN